MSQFNDEGIRQMDGDSIENSSCPLEDLPDSPDQWPPFGDLLRRGILLRKATSWGNTDTYVLRTRNGTEYLLKTFARQPPLIRILLGRISIRNEYNTLKFLEKNGLRCAPRAYGILHKDSILMEYISDGTKLLKKERYTPDEYPSAEFFRTLISLMRDLHGMGVSHGDLRRANILRLPGEIPVLIDWATAMVKYPEGKKISLCRAVYNIMIKSDLYSLASITESYYPELLDAELQQFRANPPWCIRLGRFLRQKFYRQFLKQLTKRRNHSADST